MQNPNTFRRTGGCVNFLVGKSAQSTPFWECAGVHQQDSIPFLLSRIQVQLFWQEKEETQLKNLSSPTVNCIFKTRSCLCKLLSWVSWKSLARDHSSYPRALIFGHVVIEWIAWNPYYEQYLIDPLIWPQEGPEFAHVGPYYQAAL